MHALRQPHTIALVTDSIAPALSASDQTLVEPLRMRGIQVVAVPWESHAIDWPAFDLVVLRSCWNYHRDLPAFRSWLVGLEASGARVWNPVPVIYWNLDKRYLCDLTEDDIAVVPTIWLEPGQPAQLAEILEVQGWEQAVVKPRVSASAHGIWQTDRFRAALQQSALDRLLATTGAMIQPLMPQIAAGEWSLVFFGGAYSHATLKVPGSGSIFVQQRHGGSTTLRQPDQHMIMQAAEIVHAAARRMRLVDEQLLYARVDGLDIDGQLILMELELIEPGLFLDLAAPDAPTRFAETIAQRISHR
jgi:hypothetical protein